MLPARASSSPSDAPGAPSRLVVTCWCEEPPRLEAILADTASRLDDLGPGGAPHLLEARLDLLGRPCTDDELARFVQAAGSRLIATCRPGGPGAPAGDARPALLARAVEIGARGCDLERESPTPRLRAGALVIRSHHADSELSPAEAARLARELAATEPGVVKLAAPSASSAGAWDWMLAAGEALPAGVALAPLPLGSAGAFARLLAGLPLLPGGRPVSALAYVRAGARLPGPDLGQPSLDDALGCFDVPRLGAATRLHAVLGWPLARTFSPALHSELFRRRGVDARLVALPVRDAGEFRMLDALGIRGAAVTMPHKALAAALATHRSERVTRLGSANTLRRRGDAWEAEDFDGPAAARALATALDLRGARVAVLGAGGAARAASLALVQAGARVHVLARRPEQAREAALRAGAEGHGPIEGAPTRDFDALVQGTPAGGAGHEPLALTPEALPRHAVLDMVTTPSETPLVRMAREASLRVVDGLSMLALQAAAQQRWWSEAQPDDAPALSDAEVEVILRERAACESLG